jgi:hypothetical protein
MDHRVGDGDDPRKAGEGYEDHEYLPPPHGVASGGETRRRRLSSGSGHGPYLLAGLGGFFHFAEFNVVVCADCGLTRLFAEPEARDDLGGMTASLTVFPATFVAGTFPATS